MFNFLNLQPDIFGVDINDMSIRIANLTKRGRGFKLVSFNEINIPAGVVEAGVIQNKEVLTKLIKLACNTAYGEKLKTKYLIASLPEEKSFFQVIQMPEMNQEELKSAIVFEAENYIPLPIDKVYLDYQVINSVKKKSGHLDLLINAVPKSIIDSYVFCFRAAGLIPSILEVESQAIARALMKYGEASPPTLLIDFGGVSTSFVLFAEGSVRFTSSISVSSEQLTKAIADKLGVSMDKAEELKIKYGLTEEGQKQKIAEAIKPILTDLIVQIKKYINFYNSHAPHGYALLDGESGQKIEKIIISGGGSNLKGLYSFFEEELKVTVEMGNPLINIDGQNKGRQIIPRQKVLSFTTALGLALRGATENF